MKLRCDRKQETIILPDNMIEEGGITNYLKQENGKFPGILEVICDCGDILTTGPLIHPNPFEAADIVFFWHREHKAHKPVGVA